MTDRPMVRWLSRCFTMAMLILALGGLLIAPNLGQAQSGEEEERRGVEGAGERSRLLLSDDPSGRNLVPVAQAAELSLAEERELARRLAPLQQESSGPESQGELDAQAYGSPLMIPAAEFAYAGTGAVYQFVTTSGFVKGGPGCGMAPLYLPDGAIIASLWSSMYDNDATSSGYAWIYVYRLNNTTGIAQVMGFISTSGYGPSGSIVSPADMVVDYPKVQYPTYSYYAYGCVNSANTRIYSLRVYYTLQ